MLSIVIQYSTNEFKFLERNLEQSCKFADEVVLCLCNRFFDGSPEDARLIEATLKVASRHPKCRVHVFEWEGSHSNPNYYHNLSRKIGGEAAAGDWLLFLDADEILDNSFGPWSEAAMKEDSTFCLSCYWYFRSPRYRSRTLEGCGLLIKRELCRWDINQNLERQQLHRLPNFRDSGLFGGSPLVHHFSWVRSKEEMLKKVRKWGHKNDRDWVSLVSEEFSRPFSGRDFVHGYEYDVVDGGVYAIEDELEALLTRYVYDPADPDCNFDLGVFYEDLGHTASAMSYYLRAAERATDPLLQFECLVRASMCFEKQGCRNYTVKGLLQHALTMMPKRPEGYYLLSRFHEKEKAWQESYMMASIGDQIANQSLASSSPLRTTADYPGEYGLLFQKAVSGWWCGLCKESQEIFKDLIKNHRLDDAHMKSVMGNLQFLNAFSFESYDSSERDKLKFPFDGCEDVERNYSEAFQDMFVLSVLNGKRNGTYLEIGAGDPTRGNNTYLLETSFGWQGKAFDLDEGFVEAHKKSRRNECLLKDAQIVNYESFLAGVDMPKDIDYLQIDCDPPETTYRILLALPLETRRFAVITYEHDYYCDETKSFQDKARKYLESYGYFRVVDCVAPDEFRSYEDWWVHPELVDMDRVKSMCCVDGKTKKAKTYMTKG
jgi:hypothetical protein